MRQLLVKLVNERTLVVDTDVSWTVHTLKSHIYEREGISIDDIRLVQEGRELHDSLSSSNLSESFIHLHLRILGGKGGFGSLLRGQGPKQKMTTNFDACRDLAGRRLRHVYNDKRVEEWTKKKEEEEKKIQKEIEEYEKNKKELENAIRANHYKLDGKYKSQVEEGADAISEAVKIGIKRKRDTPSDLSFMEKILKGGDDETTENLFDRKRAKKEEQIQKVTEETKVEDTTTAKNQSESIEVSKTTITESKETINSEEKATGSSSNDAQNKEKPACLTYPPIDVKSIESAEQLESYGMEHLKSELTRCGLKCGGKLNERAARLFLLKTHNVKDLPKKYLI